MSTSEFGAFEPGAFEAGADVETSSTPLAYSFDAGTDQFLWHDPPTMPANGSQITFPPSPTLPGGLTPGSIYYVVNVVGSTFKVSLTSGGAPLDLTSSGGGYAVPTATGTPSADDIYIGGPYGYIERIAPNGDHVAWIEVREGGVLRKVWGLTFDPYGTLHMATGPIGQGTVEEQVHDLTYLPISNQMVKIVHRSSRAHLDIFNMDGSLAYTRGPLWLGTTGSPSFTNLPPIVMKITASCLTSKVFYTNRGGNRSPGDNILEQNVLSASTGSRYVFNATEHKFGDLQMMGSGRMVVAMTVNGNGPRNAVAVASEEVVWTDEINPPDGIYRVYKRSLVDGEDILFHEVALTPDGLNGEVTALAINAALCGGVFPGLANMSYEGEIAATRVFRGTF